MARVCAHLHPACSERISSRRRQVRSPLLVETHAGTQLTFCDRFLGEFRGDHDHLYSPEISSLAQLREASQIHSHEVSVLFLRGRLDVQVGNNSADSIHGGTFHRPMAVVGVF